MVNVGVDVGKWFLDICLYKKDLHWQVENTQAGIKKLLGRLARYQVERLVMEATGRYQHLLAEKAFEKDFPVCVVKPLSVRRYAQAIGKTAKTDRIDAQVIAEYGAIIQPPVTWHYAGTSSPLDSLWAAVEWNGIDRGLMDFENSWPVMRSANCKKSGVLPDT